MNVRMYTYVIDIIVVLYIAYKYNIVWYRMMYDYDHKTIYYFHEMHASLKELKQ